MSGVDDLVAWLRAQLDERERVARAAANSLRCGCHPGSHPGAWTANDARVTTELHDVAGGEGWPASIGDDVAQHIALNDPASVLADVEAKRRILDEYEMWAEDDDDDYEHAQAAATSAAALLVVIKLLALRHAGSPGYRDEWRP